MKQKPLSEKSISAFGTYYCRTKDVAEAVKKLKEIEMHELIDRFGNFKCLKFEEEIDKIMGKFPLNKTKENFNKKKDVKGEYNHSQVTKEQSVKQREFTQRKPDTSKDICANCGHEKSAHFLKGTACAVIPKINGKLVNCSCKKFKPQKMYRDVPKKGCGSYYVNEEGLECKCGVDGLCPACLGRKLNKRDGVTKKGDEK